MLRSIQAGTLITHTVALFAALMIATVTLTPATATWRCAHAIQTVAQGFVPSASAMPCKMAGAMQAMPCCQSTASAASSKNASPISHVLEALCKPTLVVNLPPTARDLRSGYARIRYVSLAAHTQVSPSVALYHAQYRTLSCLRPPPDSIFADANTRLYPGLRAPPIFS